MNCTGNNRISTTLNNPFRSHQKVEFLGIILATLRQSKYGHIMMGISPLYVVNSGSQNAKPTPRSFTNSFCDFSGTAIKGR